MKLRKFLCSGRKSNLDLSKQEQVENRKEAEGDEGHAKEVGDEYVVARVVDVLPEGVGADPRHLHHLRHVVTVGHLGGRQGARFGRLRRAEA